MTREEELSIIKRTLAGDTNAFEAIVSAHQKNVYNLALRIVGNADDAFDMSQEAFLRAYRSLENFRGDSRFSVWLYRLTSNICIDFLRKKKLRNESSLSWENDDGEIDDIAIPDLRFSPEKALDRKELAEAVRAGLDSLPPELRQILVLREINGLDYREIAQVLDIEEGTVKSRIFRARKKLCALLAESGNIPLTSPSNNGKEV